MRSFLKLSYTILLIQLSFLINSCTSTKTHSSEGPAKDFNTFINRFLPEYWNAFPGQAVQSGEMRNSAVFIPNRDALSGQLNFAKNYLDSLKRFDPAKLNTSQAMEYKMLENQLNKIIWTHKKLKPWEWNPAYFNIGPVAGVQLKSINKTLDSKLKALKLGIQSVPEYYEAVYALIKKPTKEHIQLAILQNEGTLKLFNKSFRDSLAVSGLAPAEKEAYTETLVRAAESIEHYIAKLKTRLTEEKKFRSFRLGKKRYYQMFDYELQSSFTPGELYEIALAEKEETITNILRLTQKMWPEYFGHRAKAVNLDSVKALLNILSDNHSSPSSFKSDIENQLPELIQFVKGHGLLNIDVEKPLIVRTTPGYLEGISLVSISAPGPFDKFGNTYYNVNDLTKLPPEAAESWLREYNDYMLQILNIHEAIPGHYTQLVYANESPSVIKNVFGSYSTIEGWACYAERMMLEEGYGSNANELWLMYYKWYLRIITNTLIDIGIHTKNMSKEEVMILLTNEAFQEKSEAEGKWKRASLTQVQLCAYFNGLTEILQLREEIKNQKKNDFNLRKFHDAFLNQGNSPVKYIREVMIR
jgi:Bacterial protein of unknown function (DUF885)